MKGNRFILGVSIAIAVVMTASALEQGNRASQLERELQELEQQLENVESANDVLVEQLKKLIGGR